MQKLNFSGEITIDQIFQDYKKEIYDNILKSIKDNYKKDEILEINVVNITINGKEHIWNLKKDQIVSLLNRCIDFYKSPDLEEYEKCQICLDIINNLANNKKQHVK
tara:strand:- start:736 stop:1053 length:318 start_codon:yes stop_codon:yes gene_type:complete